MTIVCFDGKTIACDGNMHSGEVLIADDCVKILKVQCNSGPVFIGMCGHEILYEHMISLGKALFNKDSTQAITETINKLIGDDKEVQACCLLVDETGACFYYSNFEPVLIRCSRKAAIGCAAHIALGAMAAGVDATQAVHCCSLVMPCIGGLVTSFNYRSLKE